MIDLIYITTTVAFFGLMILYVAACDHLGQSTETGDGGEHGQ